MNHWIITADLLCNEDEGDISEVNTTSRGYEGDGSNLHVRFRLLDADGEVYYRGLMADFGFEPLNDFGLPNAGANTLEYQDRITEAWTEL